MHITALLSFYRCIYNVPCYHFGKSLKAHLCSWYTNHSVPYLHSCEHTVFLPHNCDKSKLETSKEIKLRYWFLWLNILHLSSLLHRPLSSAIDIIFKTSRSVILTLLFPQYKSEASQLQSSVLHLYKGIIRITIYSKNLQYLFLLFRKQTQYDEHWKFGLLVAAYSNVQNEWEKQNQMSLLYHPSTVIVFSNAKWQ